jgi:hypothetical protein
MREEIKTPSTAAIMERTVATKQANPDCLKKIQVTNQIRT